MFPAGRLKSINRKELKGNRKEPQRTKPQIISSSKLCAFSVLLCVNKGFNPISNLLILIKLDSLPESD
jgi:hypothetical protein